MIRPFTTVAVGAVLLLGLTGCGSASAQNPTVTPAANADFFEPAVATPVAIPGVELFTGLSRDHTTDPVEYEQSPPVGGAHDPSWQRCLVYDAPIRNENAVHSLEHGAVWITYQPDLATAEREAITKLAKDMKLLLTPQYGAVASYKGEPAAFVVTLPNLNEWIAGMNGKLLPFNWARLATNVLRKRPSSYRMPLMGVRRKFHGTTVGSALSTLVIDSVRRYHAARGGKTAELSWILEDNYPVRKIIESSGAVPYKTYRIYQKDF